MKFAKASTPLLSASLTLVLLAAAAFPPHTSAQEQSWQVIRAEYAYKAQAVDVTNRLIELLELNTSTGRIAVNNETMGGDPAVGKDKTLRVFARSGSGEQREFDYKEHTYLDTTIFSL